MDAMNSPRLTDAARSRLRVTLANLEHELVRLPPATDGSRTDLWSSWAALVDQLALGPEPPVRECPVCKHVGMRDATLCWHCWTTLRPPTDDGTSS